MNRRALMAASLAVWATGAAARPRASARTVAAAPSDLTGIWTTAWYTHLQRPKTLKGLVVTLAEAEAFEKPRRTLHGDLNDPHDELGQATSEFPDQGPGLARIRGEILCGM